jgi:soluble P-type ATPase
MIQVDIPGFGYVEIVHAVFDYNGTLACEGNIDHQIIDSLKKLQETLEIHILTADTFGMVKESLKHTKFQIQVLSKSAESEQKEDYVNKLGASKVISFGNGNNDEGMLKYSRIGIAVIKEEGCSTKALNAADLVVKDIKDGIGLPLNPMRLKASLRY